MLQLQDKRPRMCLQWRGWPQKVIQSEILSLWSNADAGSRTTSKAFAEGLNSRILQLENMLKQQMSSSDSSQGYRPPQPYSHYESSQNGSLHLLASAAGIEYPPAYNNPKAAMQNMLRAGTNGSEAFESPTVSKETVSERSKDLITKLAPCSVRFDMASGRVRFFGPTTNLNILSNATLNGNPERHESHWPIAMLIRDLYPETHDYLMDLFWTCHNSVFHLVHKDAFYEDLESGSTQWYSIFLHFSMLATGYRYSDKSRPDIQRLALNGQFSSTLHAKAKSMAKLELERPGGIPSMQALFLLGDLEAGCGRDDTGWMFAGMAFRLVWDIGLHVDASDLGLTERDAQIRHMLLWYACVSDKHWALYLGRPTTLKVSDIAPSCLSKDFGRLINSRPTPLEKTPETRVYEIFLRLMDLLEPLCETVRKPARSTDGYFRIAALDRELDDWYAKLPDDQKWTETNIANGPPSFFLLHSQYHTALILLHRPYVNYGDITGPCQSQHIANTKPDQSNHFTLLSRTVCADNAKRIALIFKSYRSRFDIAQVFVTGLQHAGAAATALMAEIVSYPDVSECGEVVGHLNYLKQTISLMSKTYQPAAMMSSVVEHFLKDIRSRPGGSTLAVLQSPNLPSVPTAPAGPTSSSSTAQTQKRTWSARVSSNANDNVTPTGLQNKRPRIDIFNPRNDLSQGLPFLPSSWLEEMDWEDTEFLNLMGLKDLQASASLGLLDGLDERGFAGGFR